MIEFSGSFDSETREWAVTVHNGRGDQLSFFSDRDASHAVLVALEEARWTPMTTVDVDQRLL